MNSALPALISEVVTAKGNAWTGTSAALQRALLAHGGPAIGAVPKRPAGLASALHTLVANPVEGLRVAWHDNRKRWVLRTGPVRETGAAVLTRVWRSMDGTILGLATCDNCAAEVLHGLGDDPSALRLGGRLPHCGDACDLRSYDLVNPAGLVAA